MSTSGIIFGCWDLFHTGHLNALKQCSVLVDTLYVGVFSDKVILDYKRKMPMIPEQQRLEIVKHVNLGRCKILAFIVNERVPREWATRFIFVSEKLKGKKLSMVNKTGSKGVVLYIRYTPRISTSAIINRILLTDTWKFVHD